MLTVLVENSEAYEEVVSLWANCKRKIVFMEGVGEIGHIGKKVAFLGEGNEEIRKWI